MKLVFKLTLFISFLLIALFGFSAMGHGSAHCIASAVQGANCPENLFGFASFHINFFKNFSSAVFEGLGLLGLFILGILLATHPKLKSGHVAPSFSFVKLTDEADKQPSLLKKVRSWLSLLETSPTFAIAR